MQLSKPLIALYLMAAILLSACGTFEIADIAPKVTLPYSGDCYSITVLSHKKVRTPKAQCDAIKRRGVVITLEDWQAQRLSIQKNCQMAQCKQLVGAFDELFLTIDKGLAKLPLK